MSYTYGNPGGIGVLFLWKSSRESGLTFNMEIQEEEGANVYGNPRGRGILGLWRSRRERDLNLNGNPGGREV